MADIFDKLAEESKKPIDVFDKLAAKNLGSYTYQGDMPALPMQPTEPYKGIQRGQWFVEGKPATGREAAGAAIPIVADLALSAMAPEKKGVTLGIKALNALSRAGMSFIGGTGGELLGQQVAGKEADFKKALIQGGLGAAGEIVPSALVGGVKLLGKPTAKLLQSVSDFTPALNKLKKRFEAKTTGRAIDFIEGMGAREQKVKAGMDIGTALKSKKDFDVVYKDYNRLINLAAGKNDEILLDEVASRIGDRIEPYMREGMSQWKAIQEFAKDIGIDEKSTKAIRDLMNNGGYLDKGDAKYLVDKINKGWKGSTKLTKNLKAQIKEDFLTDISLGSQTGEAAKVAKEKGDAIYKATNEWFRENRIADYISEPLRFDPKRAYYERYPDKTFDLILNESPDTIVQIKNQILRQPEGKHIWAGAEFAFIKDLYEKTITKATSGSGYKRLLPDDLAEAIYAKEELIRKCFPDAWPKLKAEADYYKSIAPLFDDIRVGDIHGVASAWESISPKSKKLLEGMMKWTGRTARAGAKITLHSMGSNSGRNLVNYTMQGMFGNSD